MNNRSSIEPKVIHPLLAKIVASNSYRMVLGALVGAGIGALYWNFVGCSSGGCAITSNPYKTIILFTFMGTILARKNKN